MTERPTKEEIAAAFGRTIPDVIGPGLDVLFVGINPSLYSGATGHHFARPGNRFWPSLHLSGFTPRRLGPHEKEELLRFGLGVTNLVARSTATAAELTPREVKEGAKTLVGKLERYEPEWVAFLGIGTYRLAFDRKKAVVGPQDERIGPARAWLLPNASGLNAHYQLPDLAEAFARLRVAAGVARRNRRPDR
ncbi:MAG TPA: G/U mismatch-specific DNA glycosylase [Actinomycetota bacterium]|nr:G/U mismatch-specific DNA glycosylase [Actinomycetota bacterium]